MKKPIKTKNINSNFPLRLPPELYDKVVEIAQEEDRSINKQIISWIRDGVKKFEKESK